MHDRMSYQTFSSYPTDKQEEVWNNYQELIEILYKRIDIQKQINLMTQTERDDLEADLIEYRLQQR